MILKKKKFKSQTDPLLKAGDEAEAQMAFYLERAFGKAKDIFVLNDLRIVHEGDVAQIDHLLVTQYGLFIVESKSVHGTVAFNEHREWMRVFSNGDKKGMPSPIKQAEEQGKVVRNFLISNREKLLGKILFGMKQKGFRYCPIRIYVAISDDGVIERGLDESRVQKAQVIPEYILKEWQKLKSDARLLSLSAFAPSKVFSMDAEWDMQLEEAKKVAHALCVVHQPLEQQKLPEKSVEVVAPFAVVQQSSPVTAPIVQPLHKVGDPCPDCKNGQLVHRNGRYGKSDFLACTNYRKTNCQFTFSLPSLTKQN